MTFMSRRCSQVARGAFIAAMLSLSLIVSAPRADAQEHTVFTPLYSFRGGADGGFPITRLIGDASRNLFGTTAKGGLYHAGTVFRLDRGNRETVLYSFTGGKDGLWPFAPLLRDSAGNLYGTTYEGGVYGGGTVFKLDATGKQTVLHAFRGGADGFAPDAGLIQDAAGNFYSTTLNGGAHDGGTIFKLDAGGNETVLYNFGGVDGLGPYAGLVRDSAGNLYGTTGFGGAYGFGTVFKLDTTAQLTVLHSFGGPDGSSPLGDLIRDAAGNLYGTTYWGGEYGLGTVFEIDATGTYTLLYNFTGGMDGSRPSSGVIADAAGNLYGTTQMGGASNLGTVFKVDSNGIEMVLHSFSGGEDGESPYAALMWDERGNLLGNASLGGTFGVGTVFRVTP